MAEKKEDIEVQILANYLRSNNYIFSNIMNETGLPPKIAMRIWIKRKKLWLSKWFPDLCIILKRWSLLFIEMKKKRSKKANWELYSLSSDWISKSPEQEKWIGELNKIQNVEACFCFWADEAIQKVKEMEII